MAKRIVIALVLSFITTIILGKFIIPLLKKIKAGQPVYEYVAQHKGKNGTPTMGGLFFIVPSIIVYYLTNNQSNRIASVAVVIGISYLIIGLVDDLIKIRSHKNQGLKAYQKILFQSCIAIIAGGFSYANGISIFHLPFFNFTVYLGVFSIPLIALIFIATTNCVNLTDGIDGLAGNVSAIYLIFLVVLIYLQKNFSGSMYLLPSEYNSLIILSSSLIGGIFGFLLFNTNKASVFMGDTGSLSLGGFIASISIFSSNSFLLLPSGL